MQASWDEIKPDFREVHYPDAGGTAQWDCWYARAWQYIADAGLAECNTTLDAVRVRMRAFALLWFVLDFDEAVFGSGNEPYWGDWLDELQIEKTAVLALAAEYPWYASLVKALDEDVGAHGDLESAEITLSDEILHVLPGRAATCIAAEYRPAILEALGKGFEHDMKLAASLWLTTVDLDEAASQIEEELDHEAESITDRLERPCSPELYDRLLRQLEWTLRSKRPGELRLEACERIRDDLFDELVMSDESSHSRMKLIKWVMEGCPIVIDGYPAHQFPRPRRARAED